MRDKQDIAPDSTAARVALWRTLHVEIDPPPHVLEDEIGLKLLAPDKGWRRRGDMDPQFTRPFRASDRALDGAETILAAVFRKAEFWKKHAAAPLNERQRDILNRLLDGFEGKLTSSKYATIEKTSPDTALRDITDLVERGILRKGEGGGRSTSYTLTEE
jgi:hypothetical protein